MRPLFTIHAGELVVGSYMQRKFPRVRVWVPARDTGVDLLVTDSSNKKTVSLQVKFSRDYLVTHHPRLQNKFRVCCWWTLDRQKIASSIADFWVFVLLGFLNRTTDFVLIKPAVLLTRLDVIHGKHKKVQCYLWVTKEGRCWESRGLNRAEEELIATDRFKLKDRDFTVYLNDWKPIEGLNR